MLWFLYGSGYHFATLYPYWQPTNLDGSLPGDVGFDPLGFSEVFDVKVLREAELKHGRIAMLAVLGWIVQETAPASIHPGFPTVS